MSTESRKKKLQEAGKSHFFFTFSWPSRQPAWNGEDRAQLPWASARGKRERDPYPGPFYTLSSSRHNGSPRGSSSINIHFTPGKPRSFPVWPVQQLRHACASAPLRLCTACSFCWACCLSPVYLVIYLLRETFCNSLHPGPLQGTWNKPVMVQIQVSL